MRVGTALIKFTTPMKKNTLKLLGFVALPVIGIGTAAASVAFAAPQVPATQPASTSAAVVSSTDSTTGTDAETNDDATVSTTGSASVHETADTETNDDASGAQEVPGTETAD
jgi:cytoskeletal protein RodZ